MLPLPYDTMTMRQLFEAAWPEEKIEEISRTSVCKRARTLAKELKLDLYPDPRKKGSHIVSRKEFEQKWINYKAA